MSRPFVTRPGRRKPSPAAAQQAYDDQEPHDPEPVCRACDDAGRVECPKCRGDGWLTSIAMGVAWDEECPKCDTRGMVDCPDCAPDDGDPGECL